MEILSWENLLAAMAVMDRDRWLGRETYTMFTDAEICFDKLCLEDCLVDMKGVRERGR